MRGTPIPKARAATCMLVCDASARIASASCRLRVRIGSSGMRDKLRQSPAILASIARASHLSYRALEGWRHTEGVFCRPCGQIWQMRSGVTCVLVSRL